MRQDDSEAMWRKATEEQLKELARMRRMVSQELRKLRRRMRECRTGSEQDGCMSEMIRLSQVQMKLIPLEQGLRRDMADAVKGKTATSHGLSEADWDVLDAALKRRSTASQGASQGAGTD